MTLFKITALTLATALPTFAAAQTAAPAQTPAYVNLINDDSITSRLKEAGYTDITVMRDGGKLTIDATKDGAAHNLVYDISTGALTEVDGAGYTVESSAPAVTTGDANSQGKTDQGGLGGKRSDSTAPKGGMDGKDSGTTNAGTEPKGGMDGNDSGTTDRDTSDADGGGSDNGGSKNN